VSILTVSVLFSICEQSWAAEAMKRSDEALNAYRFNFFANIKRFITSLLYFFAIINVVLLHRFPNLPLP
jgi:hypothetical protein